MLLMLRIGMHCAESLRCSLEKVERTTVVENIEFVPTVGCGDICSSGISKVSEETQLFCSNFC